MHTRTLTPLALALCLFSGSALAQTTATATPAKQELVTKLLKLQQPGIEALARNLAEQPAAQMLNQASVVIQARVAPDKREALAKDIGADVRKYTEEAVPLVRNRALQLAPSTAGKILEERLSEDELRQVIALLESPAYAKYMQLSGDLNKALLEKLVAETRTTIEPKVKALEANIGKRLNAAAGAPGPAPAK